MKINIYGNQMYITLDKEDHSISEFSNVNDAVNEATYFVEEMGHSAVYVYKLVKVVESGECKIKNISS